MVDKSERLFSLDALRGFDMFFITGGAGFVCCLCGLFGCGHGWLVQQMHHVPWEGLAHHDTIFPLFLFLAGVSWPFSLAAQQARGRTQGRIHLKILFRVVALALLGMIFYGSLLDLKPTFRIPSVLGYIGLSWGLAALAFLHLRKTVFRVALVALLLVGYWALLAWTGAPGAPAGADLYSREWNVVSWLDRTLMPNHIWSKGRYDPESFFSIMGGTAMALLGMLAGAWLRRTDVKNARKALGLVGLAALLFVVDLLFIHVLGCKIVKALWTPSFVLSAATYSAACLALFYFLIDVCGWTRWAFYFRVIGLNSITIYLVQRIVKFASIRDFFFGGLLKFVPNAWQGTVSSFLCLLVIWVFLYFLYRKKIFLKV